MNHINFAKHNLVWTIQRSTATLYMHGVCKLHRHVQLMVSRYPGIPHHLLLCHEEIDQRSRKGNLLKQFSWAGSGFKVLGFWMLLEAGQDLSVPNPGKNQIGLPNLHEKLQSVCAVEMLSFPEEETPLGVLKASFGSSKNPKTRIHQC